MSLSEALSRLHEVLRALIGESADEWVSQKHAAEFSSDYEWAQHLLSVHRESCQNDCCRLKNHSSQDASSTPQSPNLHITNTIPIKSSPSSNSPSIVKIYRHTVKRPFIKPKPVRVPLNTNKSPARSKKQKSSPSSTVTSASEGDCVSPPQIQSTVTKEDSIHIADDQTDDNKVNDTPSQDSEQTWGDDQNVASEAGYNPYSVWGYEGNDGDGGQSFEGGTMNEGGEGVDGEEMLEQYDVKAEVTEQDDEGYYLDESAVEFEQSNIKAEPPDDQRERQSGRKSHRRARYPPQTGNNVCEYCGAVYMTKSGLSEHKRANHLESRYTCDICNKKCQIKSSFEDHMSKHKNDPKFICEKCSRTYFSKPALKKHQTHCVQNVIFSCEVCKKTYESYSGLSRHVGKCNKTSFSPRLVCVCAKKFVHISSLRRHKEKCVEFLFNQAKKDAFDIK